MKFRHYYTGDLSNALADGSTRYELSHPWLDVKHKLLIGTDGHSMVILPVLLDEGETSGPVPWNALKHLADGESRVTVYCGTEVVVTFARGEQERHVRPTGKFPAYRRPDVNPQVKGLPTVTLNAVLLLAVQDALGAKGVSLWITDDKTAVVIGDPYAPNGRAVLMPMRHNSREAQSIESLTS
jgi:hypothetical protein